MHGQQENKDLSSLYESVVEEGIMSRMGARAAGVRAGAGQYFGNIGRSLTGKASPVSAGQAAQTAKLQSAYKSAAKNLITDLQKLNLLPKQQLPQAAADQVVDTLGSLVGQMSQAPAASVTPATETPVQQEPRVSQPQAASRAAQRKATQTKSGAPVDQLSPEEEAKFLASLPGHPVSSKTRVNPPTKKKPSENEENLAFSPNLSFKKFFGTGK